MWPTVLGITREADPRRTFGEEPAVKAYESYWQAAGDLGSISDRARMAWLRTAVKNAIADLAEAGQRLADPQELDEALGAARGEAAALDGRATSRRGNVRRADPDADGASRAAALDVDPLIEALVTKATCAPIPTMFELVTGGATAAARLRQIDLLLGRVAAGPKVEPALAAQAVESRAELRRAMDEARLLRAELPRFLAWVAAGRMTIEKFAVVLGVLKSAVSPAGREAFAKELSALPAPVLGLLPLDGAPFPDDAAIGAAVMLLKTRGVPETNVGSARGNALRDLPDGQRALLACFV